MSFAAARARVVRGPSAMIVIESAGLAFRSSRMMSTDGRGSGLKSSLDVFSPARREGQVVGIERAGCCEYYQYDILGVFQFVPGSLIAYSV